jgi:hypothetical protein
MPLRGGASLATVLRLVDAKLRRVASAYAPTYASLIKFAPVMVGKPRGIAQRSGARHFARNGEFLPHSDEPQRF